MGRLSKVKKGEKNKEKQEEETGVREVVDNRERQNDSGRGMGCPGEGLGAGLNW